ncbi:MAG: Rpn family recombination-promoting nuclease/putative transposase, partial [Lachnospiraceae bacterium]|nr:Rpn family recombination-promoting nuclease/putative transposase [Lachnospiraceae bacterium]
MKKTEYEVKPNREHKDSLFRYMFKDPKLFLEAYNALMGTNFRDVSLLEDVTLSDILFNNKVNDLAFVVDDRLVVLIEHQSTINENLPLRLLMYVARVYERIIDKDLYYRRKMVRIPRPQLLVLYNGLAKYPAHKTLSLSDAFEKLPEELEPRIRTGMLELEVEVYNINAGYNEELVKRSEYLNGYVTFESIVADEFYDKRKTCKEALKIAYNYCKRHGIIAEYLRVHFAEVENMLYTEFDEELAKKTWQEEAFEDGMEAGIEKGI